MYQVVLEDVTKRFGSVDALTGVSFGVAEGRFFVLLGPSAAGKTTTLRCIAGLERPDFGRVAFDGEDITHAPVQGRPMAMIFQTFALYPHLSVRRNLSYGLREARVDRVEIDRRVDEMAEMLGIAHTLERLPATLSGGEQQRVAIGRALVRRPKLLLLDEPLTNLDAKLRHDTRAEFRRLHRELGMTMIYATPDQLEALSMGEEVAVLRHGAVSQIGAPDELYDRPGDDFVAALVGAPAINLVAGERTETAGIELPFMRVDVGPWQSALEGFATGTPVLFGIRPQDLTPVTDLAQGPSFPATVHLREPSGDLTVLDLVAGEAKLKMVLPEETALEYAVGDRLQVELRVEHSHVFARETGTAIR